ncbi:glycoside hydrolase [Mycena belliarum]|uniref:Glycoside hydrolase n=1 Tax=Mycena belliarum TaxID=1033014 RepID=A0AAD6XX78_9AGAR|nr:glycoside hydrolase [Mycena belliae]
MNSFSFLLLLLRIAQSAPTPNYPLLVYPLQPTYGATPIIPTDEVAFLLPVPDLFPSSSTSGARVSTPLVMAYYPDWAGPDFPPEKVDFTRYDWIDFAFALPTKDCNLSWDDPDTSPALLARLVKAAHSQRKKVKLSVGGWTGSQHFSSVVSTDQNRMKFVKNICALYNQFHLDGIDIDWEYPGHQGEGDNEVSPNDTANLLAFLQLLRRKLPSSAAITAATLPTPFYGANGQPLRDVSAFAKVFNWITLMNYDVWGSSQTPGPNAPLYDACNNSSQPDGNAVAAFKAWTAAGFPASKLVLGVPAYGYLSQSNATRLRTRGSPANVRLVGDGDQIQFRGLLKQGALVRTPARDNFGPVFSGGGGFTRYWDKCSSTPFLRSPVGQVVTYDDVQSLGMKAAWTKQVGMLGVNMFDVHGDTDGSDLADSVRRGLGLIRS